ncbi:S9 family peptidase [Diaminobutyricimonas sp. LJ205]|uniref:S9 family peptidase n=1 Tax=Diaminobutyricimonas sp. LJ205 TaxID=2683590 RepID=UPI0012F50F61|nr:S9 family peptidase [Diaminobutyricimonas sp. LJ205]
MKTSDLPLLQSVSRPTIDPTGERAVVSVTRPDFEADSYVGQLWAVLLSGRPAARRLTRGFRDTAPQFSPDGTLIAFIRASAADSAGQLHVVDAIGGEPVQVTDQPLGIGAFRWSPDGTRIAFTARVPEHGRYGTVSGLGPGAEPARQITTTRYKANGLGYSNDRRSHVFTVRVPNVDAEPVYPRSPSPATPQPPARKLAPEPVQLSTGDYDHLELSFSPDGRSLLAVSARHERRDRDLRTDLWRFDLSQPGSEPQLVTGEEPNRSIRLVEHTPTGSVLFTGTELGRGGRDFVGRNESLYLLDSAGKARRLTDAESVDTTDTQAITITGDDSVLVQTSVRGALHLLEARLGTNRAVALTAGPFQVQGAAAASGIVAVTLTAADTAGDVAILRDGRLQMRTDFSGGLRRAGVLPAKELTVTARDSYPVHGWVVLPKGTGPHPVLLNIHGGPFAAYSASLFDEAQVYADAGYAVVMCNPRGSSSYGQKHGRAIRKALGTVDHTDVLDFLEGAIGEFASLDDNRVGIMGGSYGGYLTAWTIAHDHRFAAAIVERGFLDATAFAGNSDIGTWFGQEYLGSDPEQQRAQSAQTYVDSVKTPTLVIHSEQDLRCPVDQAERYYQSLKRNGVDAELVLFPGEDHELSRTGRPRHRRQRFEIILDWWQRHLPIG